MRNLRLILEYDGTDFQGWQWQPDRRTVQGELQMRLERLYSTPIQTIASGRTDAGVHALGQVVNFQAPGDMPLERLHHALNGMLPPDIAVRHIDEVPPEFHARFDARRRRYCYRIEYQKRPIGRHYAWHMRRHLDISVMQQAAQILVGCRDFTSFCVAAHEKENRVCEIFSCAWEPSETGLVFRIEANRFLRTMVRSIVGTIVEMGRGVRPAHAMYDILKMRDRQAAGESAPARGLFLEKVIYET